MIRDMRAGIDRSTLPATPHLRLADGASDVAAGRTAEGADPGARRLEIEQVLAQSRRLLGRLRTDRSMLERKLAAAGRVDPIREVRGASALDEAIDRTVAMIRRLEIVLEGIPGERRR